VRKIDYVIKQFGRGIGGAVRLSEVVLAQNDGQTALVQDGGETLNNKKQVALHQTNGDRFADGAQDAQARDLGYGLLAAALLLFGFDGCIGSGLRSMLWRCRPMANSPPLEAPRSEYAIATGPPRKRNLAASTIVPCYQLKVQPNAVKST